MGFAGFDYVIIDLEHSPKNWETVANMVRAAELHEMTALIRVAENSEKSILAALEIGAGGIVMPFVETEADVAKVTRAAYYGPLGARGTCTLTRAAHYGGLRAEYIEHTQRLNRDVVIVAQIESPAGVKNIDSIASCKPGIDAVIIGRSDLASALGHAGQTENPAVIESTHDIIEACKRHHVPSGIGLYAPQEAAKWIEAGCGLFFYSADSALLLNAAKGAFDGFQAVLRPINSRLQNNKET
jgi:2-keto-3-deoxy-L-rhamnonate aldolase RhmA